MSLSLGVVSSAPLSSAFPDSLSLARDDLVNGDVVGSWSGVSSRIVEPFCLWNEVGVMSPPGYPGGGP